MHNVLITVLLMSCTSFFGLAQQSDAQYNEACICISKIDLGFKKATQYKEMESCVQSVIGQNKMMTKLQQSKTKGVAANGEKITIEDQLIANCPAARTILSTSYDLSQVPTSVKKKALKYYKKGLYSYRLTNYKSAIKDFTKAAKKDASFVMTWDLLGMSFAEQGDFRAAISAYEKSIAQEPFGRIALINKARAHEKLGAYRNAIKGYQKYIQAYPKNPEGYFRIGAAYHKIEDYENALDNTMKSFKIFRKNSAPFLKEALRVITVLRNDLTDKNRLDLWNKYSKKYNLTVGE